MRPGLHHGKRRKIWRRLRPSEIRAPTPCHRVPGRRGCVPRLIPTFLWSDAVFRAKEMDFAHDGLKYVDHLRSTIKLIYNIAGNTLINQHSDINRTIRILKDESLCELIVTSDLS